MRDRLFLGLFESHVYSNPMGDESFCFSRHSITSNPRDFEDPSYRMTILRAVDKVLEELLVNDIARGTCVEQGSDATTTNPYWGPAIVPVRDLIPIATELNLTSRRT